MMLIIRIFNNLENITTQDEYALILVLKILHTYEKASKSLETCSKYQSMTVLTELQS